MKFLKIIFFVPFFMLASCETITDWTESIIPGDDEFVEEGNDNQQLLSDEIETKDPSLAEILAESMNEDDFEIADEQLSATPAKEYDSVLIDQSERTHSADQLLCGASRFFRSCSLVEKKRRTR